MIFTCGKIGSVITQPKFVDDLKIIWPCILECSVLSFCNLNFMNPLKN